MLSRVNTRELGYGDEQALAGGMDAAGEEAAGGHGCPRRRRPWMAGGAGPGARNERRDPAARARGRAEARMAGASGGPGGGEVQTAGS
ncbi:MAG: hypothetical protein ACYSW8_27320 [Planctomycetota bacterium]